mmetsp:Transcript_16518/g.49458  ORF Transcript_16518/g.49458 Transcript_16518/m.49458 type:complete len:219 (+) Transcript_16518:336-992(+)
MQGNHDSPDVFASGPMRPRAEWSAPLHSLFVAAVHRLEQQGDGYVAPCHVLAAMESSCSRAHDGALAAQLSLLTTQIVACHLGEYCGYHNPGHVQLGACDNRSATDDSLCSTSSDTDCSGAATPDSAYRQAGLPMTTIIPGSPGVAGSASSDGAIFIAGLPPLATACTLRHAHNEASACPQLLASISAGIQEPQGKLPIGLTLDKISVLEALDVSANN